MPPNTSMPGTTFMTSTARSAVMVTWFFNTSARMPLRLASTATSMSSMLRPNTSGSECTWKSMVPCAGLTFGGAAGNPTGCAIAAKAPTRLSAVSATAISRCLMTGVSSF